MKSSVKKLAKKVKIGARGGSVDGKHSPHFELLLSDHYEDSSPATTPTGTLALYVGEERQRFVVPTGFLSHPLFKMLLEKTQAEFGYEQRNGLVIPCRVSTFEEVVSVIECCHGQFDIARLVDEISC
ncbi:auxin-induced protein 15A-like [Papaver somniferum]|uniref:auxin-induced protein 15A-like n=1 Tax=Papaver somniferum TaxID=3469 RepID=UPI000E6F9B6A|nr:auxin-induced protein 15A-like [Papaver somniferum]